MQTPALERSTPATITTAIITRLHRYKALLLRRWWIPVLTTCLGLFVGAWMIFQAPNAFLATSKMMVAGKMNLSQNAVYSEDTNNFYGTQIQLMQSDEVSNGAQAAVRATHPEFPQVKVTLSVTQRPRTSIFELE